MAFNIIAETRQKLDFDKIHKDVYIENLNFDLFQWKDLG